MTTDICMVWVDLPALDIDRATKFYGTIFGITLEIVRGEGFATAKLPNCGRGGAVTSGDGYIPSTKGPMVYLNAGDDVKPVLNRVEAAGGQVVVPCIPIDNDSAIAVFMDSEGNRVGLFSQKGGAK